MFPLVLAALFSGAAALMYQVAWTRSLVVVTSATTLVQSLILAVFMAGLGAGAILAGQHAHRARRPLVAYATIELVAALLSVAAFPLVVATLDLPAWSYRAFGLPLSFGMYAQLTAIAAYLLLPTSLLGASLPLLIEHFERSRGSEASTRGRFIAALYAINTAGAIVGCYLAGYVSIPALGLTSTAAMGAAAALVAAGLALATSARGRSTSITATIVDSEVDRVEADLLLAAFLAGFVGLAAEVFWLRIFALVIPTTVYAFTQVVIAVLLGISLGSLGAAVASRRGASHGDSRTRARSIAGTSILWATIGCGTIPLVVSRSADLTLLQEVVATGRSFVAAALLLGCVVPVAGLIGAVLPLVAAVSRASKGSRAFGFVYGANTLGSLCGSLAAGLLLIPFLGLEGTGATIQILCLLLAACLLWKGPLSVRQSIVFGFAIVASSMLYATYDIPADIFERRLGKGEVVREFREGASSHVMVTEEPATKVRKLWINSSWVASSGGPHRSFGHLPAIFVANPRRALGIALGTGQTFAAVLDHGVEQIDCVEIDAGVIELARRWFSRENGGLLDDRRARIHIDDGRAFLRATADRYDVIVLEPLQAWSAGTSSLYSKEFYREARAVLARGGVLSQWIPFYGQGVAETRAMVNTGLQVFEHGSLWLTGTDAILLLSDTPFDYSLETLGRRIAERNRDGALERFPAASAEDLLAYLLLGERGLRSWLEGADILEDDRPLLEFRAAAQIGARGDDFVAALRDVQPHLDRLSSPTSRPTRAELRRYKRVHFVRQLGVELRLLPDSELSAGIERLESLPERARNFTLWRRLEFELEQRMAAAAR